MSFKNHFIVVFLAVIFGVIRFLVHPHSPTAVDVYKDVVHVYMGVIGTLAWQGDRVCKYVFWSLSALEVAVAFLSRV